MNWIQLWLPTDRIGNWVWDKWSHLLKGIHLSELWCSLFTPEPTLSWNVLRDFIIIHHIKACSLIFGGIFWKEFLILHGNFYELYSFVIASLELWKAAESCDLAWFNPGRFTKTSLPEAFKLLILVKYIQSISCVVWS